MAANLGYPSSHLDTKSYRPEIDGLRALAVLLAVFYHAAFDLFKGGYIGVDIFFVISGYLITNIIIEDMYEGKFSLSEFFDRRARRIFPALFCVLAVCLPLAWYSLSSAAFQDFGQSMFAVAAFAANIHLWQENTYFAAASDLKPLLHTWTIAVEQQFYIIYPIFLILAWRLGLQRVITIIAFLAILSLMLAVWDTQYNIYKLWPPGGAYFLLPTRLWQLAIGAFVAFYLRHHTYHKSHTINQALSIVGIAMIVYSVVVSRNHTRYPDLSALIPTLGTALLILCAVPQTIAHKLFSAKPIVVLGLLSYSIYLWHQPLIAFARHSVLGEVPDSVMLLMCCLSLGLAWLSWEYVEQPFRGKSSKVSRKQMVQFSICGILTFGSLGLLLHFNNGFNDLKYQSVTAELASIGIKDFEHDNGDLQQDSWSILRKLYNDRTYGPWSSTTGMANNFDLTSSKIQTLIAGNSHSKDLFNVFHYSSDISQILDVAHYSIQLRHIGPRFYKSDSYSAAEIVVLASGFRANDLEVLYDVASQIVSDKKKLVVVAESFPFLTKGRMTLADHVIQGEAKKGVSSLDALIEKVNAVHTEHYINGITTPEYPLRQDEWREVKKRIEADLPYVVILDKMDYICPNNQCYGLTDKGHKIFFDDAHHALSGAKFFGEQLSSTKFYDDLIEGLGLSDQKDKGL